MPTLFSLPATDADAINRVRNRWLAALNADQIDGLIEPLTTDSMAFPPHEPALQGPDAMRAWHQANSRQFTTRLKLTPEELRGVGDLAFDRFSYAISLTPKAGGSVIEDDGQCVWIWQRDEKGTWRIARSIWNSSRPMPVRPEDARV